MGTETPSDSSAMNEISKGTFTAIFERAILGEPLQRMKVDFQVTKKINLCPFWLYSSLYANSANMTITTTAQFYFNYMAKQITAKYFKDENNEYGFHKAVLESCAAGALSAVLTSPIEAAMINQSTTNSTFIQSSRFLAKHGVSKFYRGLSSTIYREAIFTSSYIALTPYFQKYLKDECKMNESYSWFLSVFGIGAFASIASQPFDTINAMQKGADINTNLSFRKIVSSNNTKDLFKGAMIRSVGVMWAIGMYNLAPEIYNKITSNNKKVGY